MAAVLVVCGCARIPLGAPATDGAGVALRWAVQVVAYGCGGATFGSGSVVDGKVVTAAHVVSGASGVEVRWGSKRIGAAVRTLDQSADLAVLFAGSLPAGLGVSDEDQPGVGDQLTLAGFPGGQGFAAVAGTARGRLGVGGSPRTLVDAPSSGGVSGGPALDSGGRLAGVATDAELASGSTLVAGASLLRPLLGEGAASDPLPGQCR